MIVMSTTVKEYLLLQCVTSNICHKLLITVYLKVSSKFILVEMFNSITLTDIDMRNK